MDPNKPNPPPATYPALASFDHIPVVRWLASSVAGVPEAENAEATVCATMWPTRTLLTHERWFDELYVWTEGFQATTTHRARIQLAMVDAALEMMEHERAERVGVTISFGTAERCLDSLAQRFDRHPLVLHRLSVILRGSLDRVRSRFRLRAFIDLLHAAQVPVGYRVSSPQISQERRTIDFLRADFAKVLAPASRRREAWQDFALEARVAGIRPDWLILGGLETPRQIELALDAGVRLGQGNAVRLPYRPPVNELTVVASDEVFT